MTRIQLGELTAGRQALEGADLAPGTQETMRQLRQRPARAQDPLPPHIVQHVPDRPSSLDADKFAANLRSSREGTAGGSSGMTNEHLRPLLDNPATRICSFGWQNCWQEETSLRVWRRSSGGGG